MALLRVLVLMASAGLSACATSASDAASGTAGVCLHKTNSDGKRLIGSGVLYRPQIAFFAKHASAQPGNIVLTESGMRAVVLAVAGAPAPEPAKKELQIALLDRPVGEGIELFRHPEIVRAGGVRFEEGEVMTKIPLQGLRYQYAGYPTMKGGPSLVVVERVFGPEAHFEVYRTDGRRAAGMYPADSSRLFYGEMLGPFEGRGGQSGGPTFIEGKLAGIHWRKTTDDYIGDEAVRRWVEERMAAWGGTVDGFYARGGRLEAEPDEVKGRPVASFTAKDKRDEAVGFPWNLDPSRGRKGTVIRWSGRFAGDFEITVGVRIDQTAVNKGKRRIVFRPVSDTAGAAVAREGGGRAQVVALGAGAADGRWHDFRFDLDELVRLAEPGSSVAVVEDFTVRGTGAFTDVALSDS